MTAGFKIADEVFCGTNGAIEAHVDALATQAAACLGPSDPLTVYFQEQRDGFYSSMLLLLDEWLVDAGSRSRFVKLLDAATEQILREGTFSEYGRLCTRTSENKVGYCASVRVFVQPSGRWKMASMPRVLRDGGAGGGFVL